MASWNKSKNRPGLNTKMGRDIAKYSKLYLRTVLLNQSGLFFQTTPKKYTGTPVNRMRRPMKVSHGAAMVPMTTKNTQAITKRIGNAMLT